MKNTILTLATTLLMLASCGPNTTPPPPPLTDDQHYEGLISVAPGTGSEFTLEGVAVILTVAEDGSTVDIEMKQVQFATAMPLKLDITIPGVSLTVLDTGGFEFSADRIVPITIGGPNERFTITDIEGSVDETGRELSFSFVCMSLPVSYTGERRFAI